MSRTSEEWSAPGWVYVDPKRPTTHCRWCGGKHWHYLNTNTGENFIVCVFCDLNWKDDNP